MWGTRFQGTGVRRISSRSLGTKGFPLCSSPPQVLILEALRLQEGPVGRGCGFDARHASLLLCRLLVSRACSRGGADKNVEAGVPVCLDPWLSSHRTCPQAVAVACQLDLCSRRRHLAHHSSPQWSCHPSPWDRTGCGPRAGTLPLRACLLLIPTVLQRCPHQPGLELVLAQELPEVAARCSLGTTTTCLPTKGAGCLHACDVLGRRVR